MSAGKHTSRADVGAIEVRRRDRAARKLAAVPIAPADDLDLRVEEAGRRMRQWIDHAHFARWLADAVAEYIAREIGLWSEPACREFDRQTSLKPGTAKFESAKALNVWITIGTWWYISGGRWAAPVFPILWEYMIACGAPL